MLLDLSMVDRFALLCALRAGNLHSNNFSIYLDTHVALCIILVFHVIMPLAADRSHGDR